MNTLVEVLRAAEAAAQWHVDQRRKGVAQEPYVNHLLEVALLVAQATGGRDLDLVIAALLHDAIEDQQIKSEEITQAFGEIVAALVQEVTDDKTLDKAVRKRKQIQDAPGKSTRAKIIKLADLTSNLRAVAISPGVNWSAGRKLEYVRWAQAVADYLRGIDAPLESRFDLAAANAEASLGDKLHKRLIDG